MKAIFTYPNNAATSYIDPLYVGDASDGFQKRIQDLKDGNYRPWSGTAPVDTVSDLMSNISKFNDYYMGLGEFNHVSIHDMYLYPLLTGSVTTVPFQISEIITSISAPVGSPAVMSTSVPQELTNGLLVLLSNFDGAVSGPALNSTYMYVQNASTYSFNLSYDAAGTNFLQASNAFTSGIRAFSTHNNNLTLKLIDLQPIIEGSEMLIPTIGDREIFLSQTSTSMSNEKSFFKDDSGSIRIGYNHVGADTEIVLVDMYYDPIGEDHLDLYIATITLPNETTVWTGVDISDDGNTIRLTAGNTSLIIQNSTPGSDGWAIIRRKTIVNPTTGVALGMSKMSGDGTKVMFISSTLGIVSEYVISTDTLTIRSVSSNYQADGDYFWVNDDGSIILYTGTDGLTPTTNKLVLYSFTTNLEVTTSPKINNVFTINDKWGYIIGSDQNSGIVNYYEMTNSAINLLATVDTGVTTNLQFAPLCAATSITNQFAVFAGYDKIIYEYDTTALTVTEIYRLNKTYHSGPRLINDVDRGTFYEVEGLIPPIVGRARRGADAMLNYIKRNNISVYLKEGFLPLTNYYDLYTDAAVTTKFDWTTIPNGNFTTSPGNPVRSLSSTVNPLSAYVIDATSGEALWVGPDEYHLTAIDLIIPGDADYTYKNASNVTTPGAEVTSTYKNTSGTSFTHPGTPNITLTTDAQGRISAATLNAPLTGYSGAEDIVFGIQALPDQYVPPAPNTAADEDIFDTQDAWTNLSGYQGAGKMFGKDIIPTTASITYVQPSTTNMSQNGRKYVRSSGFVKTKLEVNYTNLTKAEFQELHADAQAARGQAATFYLVVGLWGGKVLNFYANASRSNPRLVTPYAAGETLLKLGGFNSNEQDVFKKGEMIIGNSGNENGDLLTVLNTVDANVYGEAKIRVAYGNPSSAINGTKVFKNPYWIVVSLDSDDFQYTVDTFGLYNVTVGFETGSYT